MWYKHFCKESWNLRVYRKANLKFNQDDYGMLRHKNILRWKDFIFRACRTEGAMRGSNFFIGLGVLPVLMYLKSTYYDPAYVAPFQAQQAEMLKEKDQQARDFLFYNRYGAPTRPLRSLDDLMTFLSGSETYDMFADFVSYNVAMDNNQDQQKGLDSWMSEQDRGMIAAYQAQQKNGGH